MRLGNGQRPGPAGPKTARARRRAAAKAAQQRRQRQQSRRWAYTAAGLGAAGMVAPLALLGVPPALAMANRHRIAAWRKRRKAQKARQAAAARKAAAASQKRQQQKQGGQQAGSTGPSASPAGPQKRPHLRLATKNGQKVEVGDVATSGLDQVIEAVQQHIGGFKPEDRDQVTDFFTRLPEVFTELAKATGQAAENMGDEHIAEPVIDATRELAQAVGSSAGAAEDVYSEHLTQHKIWLD